MAQSLQHEHWVYNMSLIVAQDLIVAHSQEVTVAQSAQSLQHEHWVYMYNMSLIVAHDLIVAQSLHKIGSTA